MRLDTEQLQALDSRYRGNLINSLPGFQSATLIGTKSASGIENLAVFKSVVHVGANPACYGFVLRPTTVPRHTYDNLKANGWFTINHVHTSWTDKAHHTAAKYEAGESEFAAAGLTPEYSETCPAPYVKESVIKLGLRFEEEHYIKLNDCRFIVGRIEELFVPDEIVSEDGFADLSSAGSAALVSLDGYYKAERIARYAYARPGQVTKEL